MTAVTFIVEGVPVPQGSKTVAQGGGKAWLRDSNGKKLKPWRDQIKTAANLGHRFDGPVELEAVFYLPRPKTVTRPYPSVVPDLDKLMRALGDGMKEGGLIRDDSLIVDEDIKKRYADGIDPGVHVTIRSKGENQ